jgi:GT2 family glycosyltransferase
MSGSPYSVAGNELLEADRQHSPSGVAISVIIASWNAKDYLVNCLATFQPQVIAQNGEIVVVDNCSRDGSADAVAEAFPEVKLVRNSQNLGFAGANNIGIRQSHGRYICLANSDVTVPAGTIERLVQYLDQHPQIGVLGPKVLNGDGTVQFSCWTFPSLWNTFCRALALDAIFPKSRVFASQLRRLSSFDDVQPVDAVSGCFMIVRSSALKKVGNLDDGFFMYSEDKDWCRRFWQAGWSVVYCPVVAITHYGGGSSANAPLRFALEMERANQRFYAKHYSRLQQSGFKAIALFHHALRLVFGAVKCVTDRRTDAAKWRVHWHCIRLLCSPHARQPAGTGP